MTAASAVALDNSQVGLQSRPAQEVSNRSLARFHVVTSIDPVVPVATENATGEHRMYQPTSGRKLPLPDKNEVRNKIAKALTEAAPSAKHIARETGASVDTAEGWRAGINIPGGYNLIVLARQIPELRAVIRQLIDADFEHDPRAYSMFLEAMRYAQAKVKS